MASKTNSSTNYRREKMQRSKIITSTQPMNFKCFQCSSDLIVVRYKMPLDIHIQSNLIDIKMRTKTSNILFNIFAPNSTGKITRNSKVSEI